MIRHRQLSGAGALLILIATVTLTVRSQGRTVEWRYFGGDKAFTRYSSADQITRDNVKNLRIVWRRPAVDEKLTQAFPGLRVNAYLRSTPIMIDGMLFTQDAHGFVSAFDAGSGETVWQQEPIGADAGGNPGAKHARRRLLARRRAIRGSSSSAASTSTRSTRRPARCTRTSATTGGRACTSTRASRWPADSTTAPDPSSIGDVVVVTGNTAGAGDGGDKKEAAPEDVSGFDARTGKLLWTFHVVPHAGEFGADTWGNESWKIAGDLGAWNP